MKEQSHCKAVQAQLTYVRAIDQLLGLPQHPVAHDDLAFLAAGVAYHALAGGRFNQAVPAKTSHHQAR